MKLNRILAGLCLAVCLSGVANAATLLPNARQQFFSANGAPLAGGTVAFYIPNTSTPKDTWQDAQQTILNPNPVVLDAGGRAVIYGQGAYRQIVKDAAGNTIWDQITSDVGAGLASWASTSTGSANAQAVKAPNFSGLDGQSISFVAGFTNTGALTVNPNGRGAVNVLNDTPTGAVSLSGGEVVAGNVIQLVYSATGGAFHTALTTSSIPAGTLQIYAGNVAPSGFLLAYGQCIARTTFNRLFSVISTTFGACDGVTTFAVPDMRGRVAAGKDDMGGTDAAALNLYFTDRRVLGGKGGIAGEPLSIAQLPIFTPTGTVAVTFPTVTAEHVTVGSATGPNFGGVGTNYSLIYTPATVLAGGTTSFPLSASAIGSGAGHSLIQPTIIMNYIIKL